MEPAVGALQELGTGSSGLLGLPESRSRDSDDEQLGVGGIKPKSSPIPRRRSSLSCSDDDSQPPPSSSRRVSFADAFGLSLVSVKQFHTRSTCDPADTLEVEFKDSKEYYLKVCFALPATLEELLYRVQEQNVDLESLELLPGTTTLKGTVRVLNTCFDKLVYVRTSLDCWGSHFDLLAEYVPEPCRGVTDRFSFRITMVPPFGDRGARVDFCIRYETPFGTFWANNGGRNYVVFCHEKAKGHDESDKAAPKSCLKQSRHSSKTTSNAEGIPEITLNCGIAGVTEPGEEQTQEERTPAKEENVGRRIRRKAAAATAKPQRYLAREDEKDLQRTEEDNDGADVPVPVIDESPLNLSTPETNVASLLADPGTGEGQTSSIHTNQVPAPQRQGEDDIQGTHRSSESRRNSSDAVISPDRSAVDSETDNDPAFKCQRSDISIGKTVEKAWECFEKSALEKKGSTDDGKQTESLENKQGFPSHQYTFETIVAPLYHQVFQRMQSDRRGVNAEKSAGKEDDGSLRGVTDPGVKTRSDPEISAERANDAERHETSPGYLHNAPRATGKSLRKTKRLGEIPPVDFALPDVTENVSDATFSEPTTFASTEEPSLLNAKPFVCRQDPTFGPEQTPETILSRSDDSEYSTDNNPACSEGSLTTSQPELACINSAILQTESLARTSFDAPISEEMEKIPDKEAQESDLEENSIPIPDTALFQSDLASKVAPGMIRIDASGPSHETIKSQIPSPVFPTPSIPEETNVLQIRSTGQADPIRKTTDDCQNSACEIQSNRSAEIFRDSPDRTAVDWISERLEDTNKSARLNIPDDFPGCHDDTAVADISNDPDGDALDRAHENDQITKEEENGLTLGIELDWEEVKGIGEVGNSSEAKIPHKEEGERGEKAEVGSEEEIHAIASCQDGEGDVTKDDDEEEEAGGNRREGLAEEIRKQDDVTSTAVIGNIPRTDSLIDNVQEKHNAGFEHTSEKAPSAEEEHDVGNDVKTLESDVENGDKGDAPEDAAGTLAAPEDNVDDGASTESLTDDEMEACLLRLKNTQHSGRKDAVGKRHSVSRTWTIQSPMPPISENTDEDQPRAPTPEDPGVEVQRDAPPPSETDVIQTGFLWRRDVFSSDDTPKFMAYTLLLVVFLIAAYICDFLACFALYLLALYCLYFQVQREPAKAT